MKILLRALQFFRSDVPRLVAVFLLLLTGIGANLLKPWPLAIMVDCVLGQRPVPAWTGLPNDADGRRDLVWPLILAVLLLYLLHGALTAAQNYLAIGAGLRGLRRVRNEVFAHLQRLSLRFHQGRQAGDLIQRAAWDTYSFQTLFQQGVISFATALLSLGLMVGVMWRVNGPLTFVALGMVPLLLLAIQVFGRAMRERGAAAQAADSQVTSFVQQAIAALPLIQSYTREEHEAERFTGQTARAQNTRLSQHGWELLYGLGVAVVFGLGTAAIVGVGSHQVLASKLSVGELLIFLAYLAQLYEPLNQLSHVGATVATASAGAQRVFDILDAPEDVKDKPEARPVLKSAVGGQGSEAGRTAGDPPSTICNPLFIRGTLAFDHVSFGYQPGQPVLREVSFVLPAGRSAALVGPSGVGKTTLLHLLPRFFDPAEGAVKLDGVDLRDLRLRDLRAHMALVLQEPLLLPATLAENIAYGRPAAGRADIEAAARAAHADEFIQKLPQKYDTLVGEGAARLSVGEKQRLALARAFLKDAPILLLDEPTSALDTESETLVLASLGELMRGRTTLIVAHRPATLRRVDTILVLQDGRLVETGPPAELLQKPGCFAAMVSRMEP